MVYAVCEFIIFLIYLIILFSALYTRETTAALPVGNTFCFLEVMVGSFRFILSNRLSFSGI